MIELYGKHFIYDGVYSRDFNLIIANVSTSREEHITGVKKGRFIFNRATKTRTLIGDDYADTPLSFDIDIVTCDGSALEFKKVRQIEKWLFENSLFRKLYIDPADDPYGETSELVYGSEKRLYFNCRFLGAEKLSFNGGVVGFKCTLETDSKMLWQDATDVTYDFTDPVYTEIEGEQVRLMRGDVDFDGELTAKDAQRILVAAGNIMAGLPSGLTELQEAVADMDGDESITSKDSQIVLMRFGDDMIGYPTEPEYIILDDGTQRYLENGEKYIDCKVDSDIDGYTYPLIILYVGSTGSLSDNPPIEIRNCSDDEDRVTRFEDVPPDSVIVIDSSVSRIGDNPNDTNGSVELYNKMTSKVFPRLVDGLNQFIVSGNISSIRIRWNNRRFL